MPVDLVEKYDPLKPFYDQYRIDIDQFKILILNLSPWSSGQHADVMALRMFRVCDAEMSLSLCNMVTGGYFI